MNARGAKEVRTPTEGLKYALPSGAKAAESLDISSVGVAQRGARHCARRQNGQRPFDSFEALGQPMNVRQVAALLGCSVWTVRQRLLPAGLPHFRIARTGKLVFFENQIVRWIVDKQREKGGDIR